MTTASMQWIQDTLERVAIARLVDGIRGDREAGAGQLARRSLGLIAGYAAEWRGEDAAQFRREIEELATGLRGARPSMVAIDHLVGRWMEDFAAVADGEIAHLRDAAGALARQIEAASLLAFEQAVTNMAAVVTRGDVLMTHSLSSTVRALFSMLAGHGVSAIVTESRPLGEGGVLAAHLSSLGIPTRYITDAQMGIWVRHATRVVVGADAVLADGAVVNKAGTSLLALAAHDAGIPFQVCCETCKFSRLRSGDVELEEMAPGELEAAPLPHVHVSNTYFDVTPARYISAWVTEQGVRRHWD